MMETSPARVDIDEIQSLAQLMIQSNMFSDIKGVAQGAVRILAGRELGIGPVASLRGIEIVRGNLSIRSHLMAAMIKRSQRYNYRITVSTDDKCVIEFLENGELCGTSEFTMEDANRANLTGNDTWKRYPKTMLYNRAMSQGARMYCPDIFIGGVFYESEIIEAEAVPVTEDAARESSEKALNQPPAGVEPASQKQLGFLYSLLKKYGVADGDKRSLIQFVYGDNLSKETANLLINEMDGTEQLPGALKKSYIKMLVRDLGRDRNVVAQHMDDTFGHHNPALLNQEEFVTLVAYLRAETPVAFDTDDIYMPGELPEPTHAEWMEFITDTCMKGCLTAMQLQKWVLAQWDDGTVEDMTQLPAEVYHTLKGMDIKQIAADVMSLHTEPQKQVALIG